MIFSLCACDKKDSSPATSTDITDEQLQQILDEIQRERAEQENN